METNKKTARFFFKAFNGADDQGQLDLMPCNFIYHGTSRKCYELCYEHDGNR